MRIETEFNINLSSRSTTYEFASKRKITLILKITAMQNLKLLMFSSVILFLCINQGEIVFNRKFILLCNIIKGRKPEGQYPSH